MDKRKSEILLKLVESVSNEQSIIKLADTFKVSEKTIRNDIKEINRFLESHHYAQIELLGNGHIYFSGDLKEITSLLKKNNFYTYKLEKTERESFISLYLIQSKGYITVSSIANKLYVSRATLLNDLKNVKRFFQENHCKLTSHPNKGLLVEGSEADKRKLALEILCNRCQNNLKTKTKFNPFESYILSSSEESDLKRILEKIIVEVEILHNISLTDESFDRLLIYLLIAVKRIKMGFYLTDVRMDGERWLEISRNILQRISQYCGVEVNQEEEKLLSNLFINLNYLKKSNLDTKIVTLQIITRKFIEKVSEDLQIDLNGDYTFFENLVSHLESFSFRGSSSEPMEELFTDQALPANVYESVYENIHIIQQAIEKNIAETDIKYIVIHVCAAIERKKLESAKINVLVVCSGGVGTSQLIFARLKNYFNFRYIDTVARHDLNNVLKNKEHQVDLIISTIPLENISIDYVVVDPSLTGNDILRVYDKVEKIRKDNRRIDMKDKSKKDPRILIDNIIKVTNKYVKENSVQYAEEIMSVVYSFFKEENRYPELYHLLKPEYIQLDVECNTFEEAIRQSAQKLLDEGFIEERYIDAMIQSVKKYGPYIVISEGVAVPHAATDDGSNRVGMNLIRLKKPVDFLGKSVKYVCCLSVVDAKKHSNAFFHLVNSLQIPDFKKQLDLAKTPHEVAMVIKKFEQQFI